MVEQGGGRMALPREVLVSPCYEEGEQRPLQGSASGQGRGECLHWLWRWLVLVTLGSAPSEPGVGVSGFLSAAGEGRGGRIISTCPGKYPAWGL